MPKPCPPEFRSRALDLVVSGRTVVEVAELLGDRAVLSVRLEEPGPGRARFEAGNDRRPEIVQAYLEDAVRK